MSRRAPRRVLVVDDDSDVRTSLAELLSEEGAEVSVATSAEEALSLLSSVRPDLVLSDVRMAGLSGLDLLRLVRERAPSTDVVLMTAYEDMPTVVAAMRHGASEFLTKPLDLHELRAVLGRVFTDQEARLAGTAAAAEDEPVRADHLIGRDPRMIKIYKLVGQVAATRTTVLVRGESGTGKELIARAIHYNSAAAAQPFVPVNCTALPTALLESELFGHLRGSFTGAVANRRGRFALAGTGTIFLDEIGDTSPEFQTKLLRVLEDQEFYPVGA
jgi:two-component system response regulator AtoC